MPLAECALAPLLLTAPVAVVIPLEPWLGTPVLALTPDVVACTCTTSVGRPSSHHALRRRGARPVSEDAEDATVVAGTFRPRLTAPIVVPYVFAICPQPMPPGALLQHARKRHGLAIGRRDRATVECRLQVGGRRIIRCRLDARELSECERMRDISPSHRLGWNRELNRCLRRFTGRRCRSEGQIRWCASAQRSCECDGIVLRSRPWSRMEPATLLATCTCPGDSVGRRRIGGQPTARRLPCVLVAVVAPAARFRTVSRCCHSGGGRTA